MDNQYGELRKQSRKARTLGDKRNGVDPNDVVGALTPDDGLSPTRQQEKVVEYVEVVPDGAIVPTDEEGIYRYGDFLLTPTSLLCPEDMTQSEWIDIGHKLMRWNDASAWWLGDWVIAARSEWDVTYEQLANEIGYEAQTLRTYASISSRVLIRINTLSFAHHRLVAGLKDNDGNPDVGAQEYWLNEAHANKWTLSQMREAIKDDPPAPSGQVGEIATRSAKNRAFYAKKFKKWQKAKQGERMQISQVLEEDAQFLLELAENLRKF